MARFLERPLVSNQEMNRIVHGDTDSDTGNQQCRKVERDLHDSHQAERDDNREKIGYHG